VEVWKRQKISLCEQVHNMKYGSKCPSLHPSPLPFISMDNDTSNISPNHLLILPCPFCLRNFDLAWDCKLASCRHAYHSWCVVSHFLTSSKCFICEEEMHFNWWALSRIKKPNFEGKKNWKMIGM
jgi:hypothetical protein